MSVQTWSCQAGRQSMVYLGLACIVRHLQDLSIAMLCRQTLSLPVSCIPGSLESCFTAHDTSDSPCNADVSC